MSFDEGIDFNSVQVKVLDIFHFNSHFLINYSNIFFLSPLTVVRIRLSSSLIWIILLHISLAEEITGWLSNNVIVPPTRFM